VTLQSRDRRALAILSAVAVIAGVYLLWPDSSGPAVAVAAPASIDSVPAAEKRLGQLREIAAGLPAKEEILKTVTADLARREKGLIAAETKDQAQAQLIQIVRGVGRAENPPVEIRAVELGAMKPLGDAYGEIDLAVNIECRIEQLVNILAGLAARPEMIANTDLRITSANAKEKTVGVRLGVMGIVARKLVDVKKDGRK
jgi:hypothetical protein